MKGDGLPHQSEQDALTRQIVPQEVHGSFSCGIVQVFLAGRKFALQVQNRLCGADNFESGALGSHLFRIRRVQSLPERGVDRLRIAVHGFGAQHPCRPFLHLGVAEGRLAEIYLQQLGAALGRACLARRLLASQRI